MAIDAISSVKANSIDKNVNFTSKNEIVDEHKDNKTGKILLGLTLSALAVGGTYLLTKKKIKPELLDERLKNCTFKNISEVKEKTINGVKKYFIKGNDVTELVKDKQANRFLKNAKKQNQEILSDVIMTCDNMPDSRRVITKLLDNGVTVSEMYCPNGVGLCQREIVGKDFAKCFQGTSCGSGKFRPSDGFVILDRNQQVLNFGGGIKKGKEIVIAPYHLSEFYCTESANATNPRYLELLKKGEITNPSKVIHDYQNHWFFHA